MAFVALKVGKVDAESFNRSEQNTKAAFDELSRGVPLLVTPVSSSASVRTYGVKSTDVYIVVNSSGGEMKIVMPAPPGPTQAVSIKCAKGRAISVVQSDGKPMGLEQTISLPVGKSVRMVNTGTAWESFGG